jgi:DNA-binding transcriptional LysR family regulator
MIRLAAHGIGVTLVPASAVMRQASVDPDPDPHGVPTPRTHTPHILELTDPAAVHRVGVVHRADHLSAAATAFLDSINLSNRSNRSVRDL